jgi:large subunit ribosomal protein L25
MDSIVINANVRDIFGKKLAKARRSGKLPGIVYGNNKDNQAVMLDAKDFGKAFAQAGHSTIVELKIDGKDSENVLIHDVATDPLTNEIVHADFYRVDMNKAIRTEVPLHFVGEAPAVFQQEGSLLKNIEEIEVETLPGSLPSHLEVDISILDDFTKAIHVSDIKVPEGVKVLEDAEQLVCKVEPPRSEEEIAALDEEVGDAIPEDSTEEGEGVESEGTESAKIEKTSGESEAAA